MCCACKFSEEKEKTDLQVIVTIPCVTALKISDCINQADLWINESPLKRQEQSCKKY